MVAVPVLGDAALFLSNTDVDVGLTSLYWTRPYLNPATTGPADKYLWFGSTDHADDDEWQMYRGTSAAPDVAPESWAMFRPPSPHNQEETPFFVHNPGHARPWFLYYHSLGSTSGGDQSSRLVTHTNATFESGTDEGEVLSANDNLSPALCDHTGYMTVERRSATDWHAWSLTRSHTTHGRSEFGYWTSTNGIAWTCVSDDLDVRSMVDPGRILSVSSGNRFTIDGTHYMVMLEKDDDGGGGGPQPNSQVVLVEQTDEETFTNVQWIWDPVSVGLADNLRTVRAYQDDEDPLKVHLYLHLTAAGDLYYALLDFTPRIAGLAKLNGVLTRL